MSYNKETGMYEGYIYKIWNDVNDKVYIGQTTRTIKERWKGHKDNSKINDHNTILYKAINKYGIDKFHIVEICTITNIDKTNLKLQLNELEIYYISLFKANDKDYGYNITSGGNNVNHKYQPVDQYDLCKNFIKTWDSITQAAEYYGVLRSTIAACCNGRVKTSCGFVWRHKGDPFDKYNVNHVREKSVKKFDIDGNLLMVYKSGTEASIANNCSSSAILNCCRGTVSCVRGYIYRFIGDEFDKYEIPDKIIVRGRPVKQYSKEGVLLATYNTVKEASISIGCEQSGIIKSCKGDRYTCGGYIWRYEENDFDKYNLC